MSIGLVYLLAATKSTTASDQEVTVALEVSP